MKKKINLSTITCFIFLLTMIAMTLVAGTYAKYASTASGADTVVVANWSFKVNGEEIAVEGDKKTIDFGLFHTILDSDGSKETDVKAGVIAPGTSGSFEFNLENTSDVTAQYSIDFDVKNENSIPIEFSLDGANWSKKLNNITAGAETILPIKGTKAVTIKWRWVFDGDSTIDTSLGTKEKAPTITVKATVNAAQVDHSDVAANAYEEKPIFPTILSDFPTEYISNSAEVKQEYATFSYQNVDLFAGKTISKIGIPIKNVSAIDDNQTFTIYVLDKEKVSKKQKAEPLRTYVIHPKKEDLGFDAKAVNKWVYVDLTDENIVLSETETLAFGGKSDTVKFGYSSYNHSWKKRGTYFFYSRVDGSSPSATTENLLFDVYYKENVYSSGVKTLKDVLAGKNFSILGDSISTYEGYSNDAVNMNDTIGSNAVFYGESRKYITVEETWWKQVINNTGMNLLVNNSSSGSKVVGAGNVTGTVQDQGIGIRPENLHDNTGSNAGTKPDIIAVYMGINDLNAGYSAGSYGAIDFDTLIKNDGNSYTYAKPNNFAEGYAIMLHKIKTAYPEAKVFVMNMPLRADRINDNLAAYNDSIAKLAKKYDMNLVNLYTSDISGTIYNSYSVNDNLHPNAAGMDLMTNTFEKALEDKYLNN